VVAEELGRMFPLDFGENRFGKLSDMGSIDEPQECG
jgi:hypothetical protein